MAGRLREVPLLFCSFHLPEEYKKKFLASRLNEREQKYTQTHTDFTVPDVVMCTAEFVGRSKDVFTASTTQ